MKNFQQLIDKHEEHHIKLGNKDILKDPKGNYPQIQYKQYLIKIAGPVILSCITAPFTTISVLLQTTQKPLFNVIESKLKGNQTLEKYIKLGIFGDNKIYKPKQLHGYKDGFTQLGREGIKGLYKGNLTGLIMATANTQIRTHLYGVTHHEQLSSIIQGYPNLKQNFITIVTCCLADLITLPLMASQTRLILQNSSPNFRTYKNFLSVFAKTPPRYLFAGGSLLILKNSLFSLSWMKLIKQSPAYSFILSSVLSHFIVYPFMTVIRNMQANQRDTPMMHDRIQTIVGCCKRLIGQQGIKSLYRGFLGYMIVHSFMGAIILEMNLREGFFDEM